MLILKRKIRNQDQLENFSPLNILVMDHLPSTNIKWFSDGGENSEMKRSRPKDFLSRLPDDDDATA
tara:strand:+ start:480 stop:677 length:198 start_codon:yes stop_codon:yes gene_type:complete